MPQGIDDPIRIVGTDQDQFRHRIFVSIRIRVHPITQSAHVRIIHSRDEAEIDIVFDLLALFAVHLVSPTHLRVHIQHVDHHRRDRLNARISSTCEPGSPATLGRA